MIWGCFISNKLGSIVFIEGSINSNIYISILYENLLPYLDAFTANIVTNITFQQDNARSHTCKKAKAFLDSVTAEHGFTVMDDWLPYSLDMNLIENL